MERSERTGEYGEIHSCISKREMRNRSCGSRNMDPGQKHFGNRLHVRYVGNYWVATVRLELVHRVLNLCKTRGKWQYSLTKLRMNNGKHKEKSLLALE